MPLTTIPIQDLIAELKSFSSETFADDVTKLVKGHEIDRESLDPYCHFLDNGYTRNLIHKDERVEVLALCWQPGNVSSIHNHRDQQCWMLVAEGKLENQNYLVHDRDEARGTCRLEETSSLLITPENPMAVDPEEPGEPVPLFGFLPDAPMWQAIAREYLERWAHHSQIRRALGLGSFADAPFLEVGHAIVATVAGANPADGAVPEDEPDRSWSIGPIVLGPRQQAADLLTLAHDAGEVAALVTGPDDVVEQFALRVGRR